MTRDLVIAQYPDRNSLPNKRVVEGSFEDDAGDIVEVIPRASLDDAGEVRASGFKVTRTGTGVYRVKTYPYIKLVSARAWINSATAADSDLDVLPDHTVYDSQTAEPFVNLNVLGAANAATNLPAGARLCFELVFQTIE